VKAVEAVVRPHAEDGDRAEPPAGTFARCAATLSPASPAYRPAAARPAAPAVTPARAVALSIAASIARREGAPLPVGVVGGAVGARRAVPCRPRRGRADRGGAGRVVGGLCPDG
jgi:hypothetical protein